MPKQLELGVRGMILIERPALDPFLSSSRIAFMALAFVQTCPSSRDLP